MFLISLCAGAQVREKPAREPYDRKEEIIHQNKRYRIHNNYMTFGGGFGSSNIRNQSQRAVGGDFNFHIRRQYFQFGGFMSGEEFMSNNHVSLHLGYGYRVEGRSTNFAAYGGPSLFSGVVGNAAGFPEFYNGPGLYVSGQAITKILFDVGVGIEVYDELSYRQNIFGFRIIAFFSGAYRGEKRNYNPNVRSENAR